MGTNYYYYRHDQPEGTSQADALHIGKSSGGWCFALHVIPEQRINTLMDWKRLFMVQGSRIEDEYGSEVTVDQMLAVITKRQGHADVKSRWTYDVLDRNYAVHGPNNLVRCEVSVRAPHCVGHGPGTYDYFTGEFN